MNRPLMDEATAFLFGSSSTSLPRLSSAREIGLDVLRQAALGVRP